MNLLYCSIAAQAAIASGSSLFRALRNRPSIFLERLEPKAQASAMLSFWPGRVPSMYGRYRPDRLSLNVSNAG